MLLRNSNTVKKNHTQFTRPSDTIKMKPSLTKNDKNTTFSSEIGSLYPVLEEPEYMEESEEYALEAALNNILSTINSSTTRWNQERNDVANMPFRGSEETMDAIANDQITCNECFVCHETVFVIQDASYVICPQCYTYFPNHAVGQSSYEGAFGLALGFDMKTLWECQSDILAIQESVDGFLK